MGVGRIFFQGGNSGFSQGKVKRGGILFYSIDTKKTSFFAENLMGKWEISKSRGQSSPPTPTNSGSSWKRSRGSITVKVAYVYTVDTA